MYAEAQLRNRVLKGVLEKSSKPVERKPLADHARELFGISIRQACAWFNISKAMFYYERKPVNDGEVIDKLAELAERYPRYGFHNISCSSLSGGKGMHGTTSEYIEFTVR